MGDFGLNKFIKISYALASHADVLRLVSVFTAVNVILAHISLIAMKAAT